MAWHN